MLTSLVKEHQARQGAKKEVQESRKQEALSAANKLTEVLSYPLKECLNGRMFMNQE